jgi:hypothetical protein
VGLTKKKDVVEGGLLEVSRVFLNPASEASPARRRKRQGGWPKATPIGGGCASAHKSVLPPMGGRRTRAYHRLKKMRVYFISLKQKKWE